MREWSNTLRKVCVGISSATLLMSVGSPSSLAQVPTDAFPPLTEQSLSHFADTWQPITEAIATHDGEFDRTHVPSLVHSLSALAASDGTHSTLDEVVAKYGYSDFEYWAGVARSAIVAAQWSLQPPDEAELKRTIVALQSDPDIPAAQKLSLVEDVSAAFQSAMDNKPSDADIAAAKAVMPLLQPIIKPNQ